MSEKNLLSIIIVSYHSAESLEACVASIYEKLADHLSWEIVLVNNDPKQDLNDFQIDLAKVKIIDHKKNVGFGAGVNLGVALAEGEILFILNADTRMISNNIANLLKEFEKSNEIGIISGGILDEKNATQKWIAGKELSIYDLFRNNLGLSRNRKIWNSPKKIECDWVAGTAMFIKKDLFERLEGFDEDFFMYFEDMDLCRRVRYLGKKVIFFPEFKIFHGNGKSYSDKRLQKKHYYDSMEKYFQKNRGFFSWALVRTILKFFM